MGAREALEILDVLGEYGRLNTRTFKQYVMHALTGDAFEGSKEFDDLFLSAWGERRRPTNEEPLRNETYGYLRELLGAASGNKSSYLTLLQFAGAIGTADYPGKSRGATSDKELPYPFLPSDYVSENPSIEALIAAYKEVHSLLGKTGLRCVGIPWRSRWLIPDRYLVLARLAEEESAREQLQLSQKEEREAGPFDLLLEWDSYNPTPDLDPFADEPMYGPDIDTLNPYLPQLEPPVSPPEYRPFLN